MFARRFSKIAVSMLAMTLFSALLVVGCSDDDDGCNCGDNNNNGGSSGIVNNANEAWIATFDIAETGEANSAGYVFRADGTALFVQRNSNGAWTIIGTGTYTINGNALTLYSEMFEEPDTVTYFVDGNTLTMTDTDSYGPHTFIRTRITL